MTKRNIEIVLKMFLLREKGNIDWKKYAKHFEVDYHQLSGTSMKAMDKVSILSELWYNKEPFPVWWELIDILHKCCDFCPEDIRFFMVDIHDNIVNGMK